MEKHIRQPEWFQKRICQRIWRDSNGCGCDNCVFEQENGIVISSKKHARFLYETQLNKEVLGFVEKYSPKSRRFNYRETP